jgi:hypothetical protein
MLGEELRVITKADGMASGQAKVLNKHLQNTNLDGYRYISLFGEIRGFVEQLL